MDSRSTVARVSLKDVSHTTLQSVRCGSACGLRGLHACLPTVGAAVLFALHCGSALAGDIARDTPAASMALAAGLYAAPGPSAAVSAVTTPRVTASPLPAESPAQNVPAVASSVVAIPLPSKAPEAHEAPAAAWINYVAVITGIVGAIAGIAGAIMGGLGLRRANREGRRY
jgi:hypothetical protein